MPLSVRLAAKHVLCLHHVLLASLQPGIVGVQVYTFYNHRSTSFQFYMFKSLHVHRFRSLQDEKVSVYSYVQPTGDSLHFTAHKLQLRLREFTVYGPQNIAQDPLFTVTYVYGYVTFSTVISTYYLCSSASEYDLHLYLEPIIHSPINHKLTLALHRIQPALSLYRSLYKPPICALVYRTLEAKNFGVLLHFCAFNEVPQSPN